MVRLPHLNIPPQVFVLYYTTIQAFVLLFDTLGRRDDFRSFMKAQ